MKARWIICIILVMVGFLTAVSLGIKKATYIYTTSSAGIWLSKNEGATWSKIPGFQLITSDLIGGEVSGLLQKVLYVATQDGIWKKDFLGTWTPAGLQGMDIYEIEKSPDADYMLAVTHKGDIYRSSFPGDQWIQVYANPLAGGMTYELRIVPLYPATAYLQIKTQYGMLVSYAIMKSTDYGLTWSMINHWPVMGGTNFMQCTAVEPDNQNIVGIGGYDGYFQSQDGGTNFSNVAGAYAVGDAEYKMEDDNPNPRLIISSWDWQTGIKYSDDYGANWYSTAIVEPCYRVAVHRDLPHIYAMTETVNGRIFYKVLIPFGIVSSHYYLDNMPRRLLVDYFVEQNEPPLGNSRPEPENEIQVECHMTKNRITITLTGYPAELNSPQTVYIVDILGSIVRNEISSKKEGNVMLFQWDLRDDHGVMVNNGTYFFICNTGANAITKKMIVVK